MLGFDATTVREVLVINPSFKMLFGISFGYPDETSLANQYWINKAGIEESVTFHS